jgi:multidrug efflux system membrane fusion protein
MKTSGTAAAGIGLALLALAGCAGKGPERPSPKSLTVPVTVAMVGQKDVPINIEVIGNVEALSTIAVKALVGGQLTQVNFKEGDYVTKGSLLFEIDPRPLAAQLQQAKANVLRDEAALAQAEANLARDIAQQDYAKAQAGRYQQLFKQGIISREQADQYSTNADALAQSVSADRAAIQSVKAAAAGTRAMIETATLQLSYTKIFSPIDGRTGNLNVKLGNVVNANTMDLMTINEVQPIYVTFSVPENQLPGIKRYMAQSKLPVLAAAEGDEKNPETGTLTFIDNAVDMSTGTIKLKGTFANPDRRLWPGEFVRVTLRLTTQPNALTVPNQAVQTGQDGPYVYVVKGDKSVEMRPVVTGARVNQDLVVEKGLGAGETVVTEGQLRLAPGMKVQVRDSNGRAPKKGPAT